MISPRHQFDTNYTIRARKHYFSHPYLYFVLTQIVFWLLACLIFYLIFSFQLKFISSGFYVTLPSLNLHGFTLAFIIAIFLGVFLGTVSYWLNLSWSKSRPLGIIMFAHLLFFVIVVSASFILLRFFSIRLQDFIGFEGKAHIPIKSWNFVYAQIFIYAGSVNLIISFVNQMNRKFGPGVLIPMLLGKYRYPREEVRIFMFLDLESSTKIAEQLGHIRFSKLIRETFIDINHKLSNNIAEIYQYVGDGIILSWQVTQDLEWIDTINFYYACMDRINSRKEFYMKKFGLVPVFKAGVHWGPVTAVAEA